MWMLCSYEQLKGRKPVTLQAGFTNYMNLFLETNMVSAGAV